jgi:DnaJ-domain-containing protein 1
METDKDYYAILGVLPSIDDVALAAVYRALLKKYHPDVFDGSKEEAARRTREIIDAYKVLGNAEKRKAYNSTRKTNGFGSYREEEQTTTPADKAEGMAPKASGRHRRYVVAAIVLAGIGVLTWATHSSQPTVGSRSDTVLTKPQITVSAPAAQGRFLSDRDVGIVPPPGCKWDDGGMVKCAPQTQDTSGQQAPTSQRGLTDEEVGLCGTATTPACVNGFAVAPGHHAWEYGRIIKCPDNRTAPVQLNSGIWVCQ